jgi:hypothetical protein
VVKGRLERARQLLAWRLSQRGVPSDVWRLRLLASDFEASRLPASLVQSTVRSALYSHEFSRLRRGLSARLGTGAAFTAISLLGLVVAATIAVNVMNARAYPSGSKAWSARTELRRVPASASHCESEPGAAGATGGKTVVACALADAD